MKKNYLRIPSQERSFQQVFGGYDRRTRIDETQFRDMLNLTGDNYPVLSSRPPRGTWFNFPDSQTGEGSDIFPFGASGILDAASVNNGIVLCSSNVLYAGGSQLDIELETALRRRISPFGKNFFIIPDGLYVRENEGVYSSAYAGYSYAEEGSGTSMYISDENGTALTYDNCTDTAPTAPVDGTSWIDTSAQPYKYKVYSADSAQWVETDCYVTFTNDNRSAQIAVGDTITVSGCSVDEINGSHKVAYSADYKVTVKGVINQSAAVFTENTIVINRRMPVLDFVIEHNNRLWGCRYGENELGDFVNEIYCCKLADPLNWYTYEGISTDSYAVSVGCPGEFTGVGKIGNTIVFFKEDYIIKVWGSEPSDFQVLTTFAKGVQAGSDRSCVNVNGLLCYKCCGGVMAYDGSQPVLISEALGEDIYSSACAGTTDGKYYIAMTDTDDNHLLFVYDTSTGLWYRESNDKNIEMFVYSRNCLYMFCMASELTIGIFRIKLYTIQISNVNSPGKYTNIFLDTDTDESDYKYVSEERVKWFAETGEIGLSSPDNKILRLLQLRVKLGEVSSISVAVMLNSDGEWHYLYKSPAKAKGSFVINAPFPACDTYRLRLSGEGECTVYSITKVTEAVRGVRMLE